MASRGAAQGTAVRAIALGALLASGCGRAGPPPDFSVNGVGIVVRSDAAFAAQPDLPDRLRSTIEVALAYWGGGWEQVAGMTVTLEGARAVDCGGLSGASGCYDGDIRVSTGDQGAAFACVEQTVLVHEIGHAVLGDAHHLDPRWMDFEAVASALAGRPGYDGADLAPCHLCVSVWRHPPARR